MRVRVPASSANLGPGFDCFAAALNLFLELEVAESDAFALATDLPLPTDRSNLVVRAFERLHPADKVHFKISSQIPLSGGLGSSAAATVAGLLAGARFAGSEPDLLALASEIDGHPDNVAAAIAGGFVIVVDGESYCFAAPERLAAVLVIPRDGVTTERAREVLPEQVPFADAVFNVAHGAALILGLAQDDAELIAHGLDDRLHQPYRASLYPRSAELAAQAAELGALGATISGAGPSVLFWVTRERAQDLASSLSGRTDGWASVIETTFATAGAKLIAS
ncbi:MAG: homoserine kinase [Solirubrobacteraceae bacterium]|jgi:homoserine kinase